MSLGYARVVNYRKDMDPDGQPDSDESVVVVDRRNPVLGNKHVLRNKLDSGERDRVIAAFSRDLDCDLAIKGPMYREIRELAVRVISGERLALQCACKPLRCHGDVIAEKIHQMAEQHKRGEPF